MMNRLKQDILLINRLIQSPILLDDQTPVFSVRIEHKHKTKTTS
jgi:hypothetical protein